MRFSNFVDGRSCDAIDAATYDVIDPVTGATYAQAPLSGEKDVDEALVAAERAFDAWKRTTPRERQSALLRLNAALAANADALVAAECRDTGKPLALTRADDLAQVDDALTFMAGAARVLEGRAAGEYLAGHTSYVRREPIGVCAQVTPWNYPLLMAIWKIAPALAAGNTVVLKPADTTPASTALLGEIAGEVLPPGVLNVLCGDRDTGRAMVAHPIPAMVSITGSVRAGIEVAKSAAGAVKRVHLELGGKAPVIVFDDADVAKAATAIADAGFYNAGQDCTAATRVLAQAGVYDDFVAALAEAAGRVRAGRPEDPGARFGPLNSARQLEKVVAHLATLPEHARIVAGGRRLTEKPLASGYFHEATVVADVEQGDAIVQDEVFGPVITVQRFVTEDEAVRLGNGVQYGLASSVWTRDHARAGRMSAELDFGCVWINCHLSLVGEMPHGGYKRSGYGKDLSVYGFEDYTRLKHVMSSLA